MTNPTPFSYHHHQQQTSTIPALTPKSIRKLNKRQISTSKNINRKEKSQSLKQKNTRNNYDFDIVQSEAVTKKEKISKSSNDQTQKININKSSNKNKNTIAVTTNLKGQKSKSINLLVNEPVCSFDVSDEKFQQLQQVKFSGNNVSTENVYEQINEYVVSADQKIGSQQVRNNNNDTLNSYLGNPAPTPLTKREHKLHAPCDLITLRTTSQTSNATSINTNLTLQTDNTYIYQKSQALGSQSLSYVNLVNHPESSQTDFSQLGVDSSEQNCEQWGHNHNNATAGEYIYQKNKPINQKQQRKLQLSRKDNVLQQQQTGSQYSTLQDVRKEPTSNSSRNGLSRETILRKESFTQHSIDSNFDYHVRNKISTNPTEPYQPLPIQIKNRTASSYFPPGIQAQRQGISSLTGLKRSISNNLQFNNNKKDSINNKHDEIIALPKLKNNFPRPAEQPRIISRKNLTRSCSLNTNLENNHNFYEVGENESAKPIIKTKSFCKSTSKPEHCFTNYKKRPLTFSSSIGGIGICGSNKYNSNNNNNFNDNLENTNVSNSVFCATISRSNRINIIDATGIDGYNAVIDKIERSIERKNSTSFLCSSGSKVTIRHTNSLSEEAKSNLNHDNLQLLNYSKLKISDFQTVANNNNSSETQTSSRTQVESISSDSLIDKSHLTKLIKKDVVNANSNTNTNDTTKKKQENYVEGHFSENHVPTKKIKDSSNILNNFSSSNQNHNKNVILKNSNKSKSFFLKKLKVNISSKNSTRNTEEVKKQERENSQSDLKLELEPSDSVKKTFENQKVFSQKAETDSVISALSIIKKEDCSRSYLEKEDKLHNNQRIEDQIIEAKVKYELEREKEGDLEKNIYSETQSSTRFETSIG